MKTPDEPARTEAVGGRAARGRLARISPPYLGLSLLIVWHIGLSYMPDPFLAISLTDPRTAAARAADLAGTVITLLFLLLWTRRHPFLPSQRGLAGLTAAVAAATAGVTLVSATSGPPTGAIAVLGAVVGVLGAVLWVSWGVVYGRLGASFSLPRMAPGVGVVIAALVAAIWLAPRWGGVAIVALLPTLSGVLLVRARGLPAPVKAPLLLPPHFARRGRHVIAGACAIAVLMTFSCGYIAHFHVDPTRPFGDHSLAAGAILGGLATLVVFAGGRLFPGRVTTYGLTPWLLVVTAAAAVTGVITPVPALGTVALLIAIAVTILFVIHAVSFLGATTKTGYLAPVIAFAISDGLLRFGWAAGDLLAWFYGSHRGIMAPLKPTYITLIVILIASLVPLLRYEKAFLDLVRPPEPKALQTDAVTRLAEDFGLSVREAEIVTLISRGYTASAIGERLFITTNTVNSHVKHIYDKIGVHKRVELITYLDSYHVAD